MDSVCWSEKLREGKFRFFVCNSPPNSAKPTSGSTCPPSAGKQTEIFNTYTPKTSGRSSYIQLTDTQQHTTLNLH